MSAAGPGASMKIKVSTRDRRGSECKEIESGKGCFGYFTVVYRHLRYSYMRQRKVIKASIITLLVVVVVLAFQLDSLPPEVKDMVRRSVKFQESLDGDLTGEFSAQIKYDPDRPQIVFFNRVPKCGSITMTRLLYQLGARNNFNVFSPYEVGERPWLNQTQQQGILNWIQEKPKPLMYIRHVYHVDFKESTGMSEDEKKKILHLNIIRDPVERFVSFYYFIRFGNKEGDGADVPMSEDKRMTTVTDCINNKSNNECQKPIWQLVPYLCGQDPVCRTRSTDAVQKAKQNVDKDYVLVGLLEELPATLNILAAKVPSFFTGGVDILKDPVQIKNDTFTLHKHKPTAEARLKLQEKLALEYDLYNYVKSKFWEQARKYNVQPVKSSLK